MRRRGDKAHARPGDSKKRRHEAAAVPFIYDKGQLTSCTTFRVYAVLAQDVASTAAVTVRSGTYLYRARPYRPPSIQPTRSTNNFIHATIHITTSAVNPQSSPSTNGLDQATAQGPTHDQYLYQHQFKFGPPQRQQVDLLLGGHLERAPHRPHATLASPLNLRIAPVSRAAQRKVNL